MKVIKNRSCYACRQVKDCWGEYPEDFVRHCLPCIKLAFAKAQKDHDKN